MDSKDLLAAEQQLLVFNTADQSGEALLTTIEAQEEAAWSLVSMGRGSSRSSGAATVQQSGTAGLPLHQEIEALPFLTPKAGDYLPSVLNTFHPKFSMGFILVHKQYYPSTPLF